MKLTTWDLNEVAELLSLESKTPQQMNEELKDKDVIEGSIMTIVEEKGSDYGITTFYKAGRSTYAVYWDFDKNYDENESSIELNIRTQGRLIKKNVIQ